MTTSRSRHLQTLRDIPCVVCGRPDVTLHHVHGGSITQAGIRRGIGSKTSDWLCLPICAHHHVGDEGIDGFLSVDEWERRYGTQFEHLRNLSRDLGYNVFREAGYVIGL